MGFINLAEKFSKTIDIPHDVDVIFVADMFAGQYNGGAELTTEALIEASPFNVMRIRSRDVTMDVLERGSRKFWVFCNFAELDTRLIPTICVNLHYAIIEYDYKFCRYRSPEKHLEAEKRPCNCDDEMQGKMVSAFMHAAKSLWWMSEVQMLKYFKMFPFLKKSNNTVLSSVFNDVTFAYIKLLREKHKDATRTSWIVLGSTSWIKGTEDAEAWCVSQGLQYEVVRDLPYDKLLEKLATAKGLVFLPRGGDTCPRIVIEARLLGCELHLNDNVQHRHEIWFDTNDMLDTEAYLYLSRARFWNGIRADMEYKPTISGYTTTRNCVNQGYPFIESIMSMMEFCDEVVVVDGGSNDGTWEALEDLVTLHSTTPDKCRVSNKSCRLVIHKQQRDWSHPRFAVFDGAQKALARSLCGSDFCWQQDVDEVVHEDDYGKIKDLVMYLPRNIPLLSLPIVEYWGGLDKVRFDVNVWKWRLSRNVPTITHGIPAQLRSFDAKGQLFSKPGSDGCDYVNLSDYNVVPAANFYTPEIEVLRRQAFSDAAQRTQFERWLNGIIANVPTVYHFSWFNIGRKVKTYRDYWSKHWNSLYDGSLSDNAESNMFFNKPWADVTEDEIRELSSRLKEEFGGWIFHAKLDMNKKTPHIRCDRGPPAIMKEWIERNS